MQAKARQDLLVRLLVAFGASLACMASANAQSHPPSFKAVILKNLATMDAVDMDISRGGVSPETLIFPVDRRITNLELSNIQRQVQTNLYGVTWQTCIRASVCSWAEVLQPVWVTKRSASCDQQKSFAVFVIDKRVVDSRSALAADQCESGTYSPVAFTRPMPEGVKQWLHERNARRPRQTVN